MTVERPAGRPELGVALGGGTARGLAHIGALKVLEERGLAPQALAGTSYGAIMAALYALGLPAVELEQAVRRQNIPESWATGLDFGLHRASLIHGRRLERWLDRKIFQGATFDDCMLPLAIACTDVATGKLFLVREGSLARAVMASSALPGIFAPIELGGRVLIDGGFVEAVPFRALAALDPVRTIAIHAGLDPNRSGIVRALTWLAGSRLGGAWARWSSDMEPTTSLRSFVRGISCARDSYLCEQEVPPGALLVVADPPISWWDFHRSPEAIAAGERAMTAALDALAAAEPGEREGRQE